MFRLGIGFYECPIERMSTVLWQIDILHTSSVLEIYIHIFLVGNIDVSKAVPEVMYQGKYSMVGFVRL